MAWNSSQPSSPLQSWLSRSMKYRCDLRQAIADAPGDPTEGVGVWISGFFGSGKSSFAKNLGYVISNRQVLDHPAARLFVWQLQEQSPGDPLVQRIADTVNFINTRFDAHVIMFDVQVDQAVRRATEPIAEIMYTVLLRELDCWPPSPPLPGWAGVQRWG